MNTPEAVYETLQRLFLAFRTFPLSTVFLFLKQAPRSIASR